MARTLLQPGDAVLVDEPGWAVEFGRLSRMGMGMGMLPVPCGGDRPELAAMAPLLAEHRQRLYVTVSVLRPFRNRRPPSPTGS